MFCSCGSPIASTPVLVHSCFQGKTPGFPSMFQMTIKSSPFCWSELNCLLARVSSGNLSSYSSTVILCPLWSFVLHMGSGVLHNSFLIEYPLSRTPPGHFQACLNPAHSDFHLLSQQDFQDLFGFPFLCPQLEIVWVESREDGRVYSYFLSHKDQSCAACSPTTKTVVSLFCSAGWLCTAGKPVVLCC